MKKNSVFIIVLAVIGTLLFLPLYAFVFYTISVFNNPMNSFLTPVASIFLDILIVAMIAGCIVGIVIFAKRIQKEKLENK